MEHFILLPISLTLFDGEAAAVQGEANQAETQSASGGSRRGKNAGGERVVYGRQPEAGLQEGSDAGSEEENAAGAAEPADRRAEFERLISEDFKDLFTERTQQIIDRRFKAAKEAERRLEAAGPVLDMLMEKYGVQDGDLSRLTQAVEEDSAYWEEEAEEAGMTVEQFKAVKRLQRENEQLRRLQAQQRNREQAETQLRDWNGQAEEMLKNYPGFDLAGECRNPEFLSMLKAGVPVRHAYEVLHMEDIKHSLARSVAKTAENSVVQNIRAKGVRPPEVGSSSQGGITVKSDVSKLSRRDREEIARRVARGEEIKF